MIPKKATRKSAKSTSAINKKVKRFTDEERVAMKERAQELKADKADGEGAVLAKLAAMTEPDRAMGKRLHALKELTAAEDGKNRRAREASRELRTELATEPSQDA